MPTRDVHTKLRKAIRLIEAATDGVRQAIPRREDYQDDDAFQKARGKIHLLLGMLCEVRGDLQDRAGVIHTEASDDASTRIAELSEGGASIWRPMADAPKDGTPILAKIKDGLTVTVDGVEQPFWWSGKCAVVSPVVTGEPRWELHALDSWWCFGGHEIEGWLPLPGGEVDADEKGGA